MCECLKTVNAELIKAGQNTKITIPIKFNFDGSPTIDQAMIVTEKADKSNRQKPTIIFATYCPFCGNSY